MGRTESKNTRRWTTGGEPLVGVCSIAYNHKPYVRDAIKRFLMQETGIPFEVLRNDDASTDATASIVREYGAGYPNIIKPIYQTENKYSQGNKLSQIAPAACRGKYIALSEGVATSC